MFVRVENFELYMEKESLLFRTPNKTSLIL